MEIKWLGLGCFLIISENGTKIITDPFPSDENIPFDVFTDSADIVTISHGHFAHSYIYYMAGVPQLYTGPDPAEIKGIKFSGVPTYHSGHKGKAMIISSEVDGIRICHTGDLGQKLSQQQLASIGKVDILLSMIHSSDETHTIQDACDLATEISRQLNPKVIIPMHRFVVDDLDNFIKGKKNVKRVDGSEIEFYKDTLPSETCIVAFKAPFKSDIQGIY